MNQRLNDTDRAQWIDNDEGLYNWWKGSKLTKRRFIAENRSALDECIRKVLDGDRPAHYMAYGG